MGSLFSSPPTPPAPPPPATYVDETSGIEQVPVKNADGSYTYITKRVMSEEQKAQEAEYKKIMNESLAEIERLSADSYEHDDNTKKLLDNWREDQERYVDKTFDYRDDVESSALARRGLTESSAGQAVRRQSMLDKQGAERAIDRDEDTLSEQIRLQNLNAQQNLYNIASSRVDLDYARTAQAASQGMSNVSSINNYNNSSLMDYYSRQNAYHAQKGAGIMGTLTSGIAGSLASGFGNALSTKITSWM